MFSRTALGPFVGAVYGPHVIGIIVGVGAFVKTHNHIGPQIMLNLHRFFRCKAMFAAITVAFEGHAVFINLIHIAQRKDLKTTAIGENGAGPIHKFV